MLLHCTAIGRTSTQAVSEPLSGFSVHAAQPPYLFEHMFKRFKQMINICQCDFLLGKHPIFPDKIGTAITNRYNIMLARDSKRKGDSFPFEGWQLHMR